MDEAHAIAVTILLIFIGLAFVWMCVGVGGCFRRLRAFRRELSNEVKTLRIYSMLERLGIGLPRYLRKAHSIDVEKHLLKCQDCSVLPECDGYLQRHHETHPSTFCPNFQDLERYMPRRRRQLRGRCGSRKLIGGARGGRRYGGTPSSTGP